MLVNLHMHISEFHGHNDEINAVLPTSLDLNKRWEDSEQPLFILTFIFHPKYRTLAVSILKESESAKGKWKETRNTLSCGRLADASMFYYAKHELFLKEDPQERKQELGRLRMSSYLWMTGQMDDSLLFPYTDQYRNDPTQWYEYNEHYISTELINFAKFLLGIPAQGASCERLFKDFSRFLTKTRNRLGHDKVMKTTMIKYDLKEKYTPNERTAKPLFASNNRFINPKEHSRVDVEEESDAKQEEGDANDTELTEQDAEDSELGEFTVDLSEAELPTSIAEHLPKDLQNPELRAMLSAILHSSPDDIDDLLDTDGPEQTLEEATAGTEMNAADAATAEDLEDFVGRYQIRQTQRATEDSFETRPEELPPLPIHNVETFPQENRTYFRRKKYVRNDKYSLSQIANMKDIKFPSTMDAFS
jgi:hypothetical protein